MSLTTAAAAGGESAWADIVDRYAPLLMGVLASVRCPILAVAGGADGVVPAEQSRPHEAAPTPKRYVEVPDADTTTSLCTPATRSSAESWPSCPDATRPADAPLRQSAASAEAARGPVGTVAG